jgi:hypothetical protein
MGAEPPFTEIAVKTVGAFLHTAWAEAAIVIEGVTNGFTAIVIGKPETTCELTHARLGLNAHIIISPLFKELSV